ncbi:MAG TPA: hypothetical protein VGA69_02210 [Nitriliruptorales bacterium]
MLVVDRLVQDAAVILGIDAPDGAQDLAQIFDALLSQEGLIGVAIVITLVAGLIYVAKLPDLTFARAELLKQQREAPPITRRELDALVDELTEIDQRVIALEMESADVRARIDSEHFRLTLVVTNFSTRTPVQDLDVRVIRRDGVSCQPVRVTADSLQLGPGAESRIRWPDEAGPAASYVLRLTWIEGDLYRDRDLVVMNPDS